LKVVEKNLRHIKENFEHASSRLVDMPCLPVSSSHDNDNSRPVLVKPLQVIACSVGELKPALHPFLNALPEEMSDIISMLRTMKVHTEIRVDNILKALSTMVQHVRIPLDPNSVEAVHLLVEMLYGKLNSEEIDDDAVLYLPDNNSKLVESTKLLFDDKGYHKNVVYNFGDCSYSVLTMLWPCNDMMKGSGFDLKSLVSRLPPAHSPLLFSACVQSRLHPECSQQNESSLTAMIKKAFSLDDFPKIVKMVLDKSENKTETCEKFIGY